MPYLVDWFIPDQVIFACYLGKVTEDEMRESLRRIIGMMDRSSARYVHVIADIGNVTKPLSPQKTLKISREEGSHERTGWNLILRERSTLVKMGVAFGSTLIKSKIRSFVTLEEAEYFLRKIDETLNWDNVNRAVVACT